MTTPSNAIPDPTLESRVVAPAAELTSSRRLLWSVRREFWENRSLYIAPLSVAALFILAFLVGSLHFRGRVRAASLDPVKLHEAITEPFTFAAFLLMGIMLVVSVFYCLDALYGERRDRSILFWKSLPVSDLTTVLAKASIPILILPFIAFVITVAMHWIMLVVSSLALVGSGISVASLWTTLSLPQTWLILFYHLVGIHGLWFAPFFAWLLLVSAWARRVPFLWALVPPLAIGVIERIAFNTSHLAAILRRYLTSAPEGAMFPPTNAALHSMSHLNPAPFLFSPALWIGLAVTAVFLAMAVRLRRYRGPM